MKIIVTIKNCDGCRFLDHSGAFTPGGAKPICKHSDALKRGEGKKDPGHYKHRVLPHKAIEFDRILKRKTPPDWCPLRKGGKY